MKSQSELVSEIVPFICDWHYRTLKHMASLGGIFGWEEYDQTMAELESMELIQGEWMGSLKFPARPMWQITDLGRKVLEHVKEHGIPEDELA